LSENRDEGSLQKATRIQPRDAGNYDLLGQYFMWDAQDARAAERQFQRATLLNPYDSGYWLHLAQAYNSLGEDANQASAIRKAIEVNPTTPEIAWNAANFFLVQGDTQQALDALGVVVRNDRNMAASALSLGWRASGDLQEIESRLPPDPEIYLLFLRVLSEKESWDAANHVWSALWALNRDFDPRSALFYVDALLNRRDVAGAKAAWDQILQRSGNSLRSYTSPGNYVVNATFDREILNAGFDWHYGAVSNVAVLLDSTQSHDGSESLMITYSGPSEEIGIYQYVPVTPGVTYSASAWVKSEELQTANGPRLSFYDPYTSREYAHSEETLGTSSWHRVSTEFTAAPDTHLILLRFSRQPSDTRIEGRFWVDGVRLSPKSAGNSDE
jgi:tetratricopeptide (TPR) repeat protein